MLEGEEFDREKFIGLQAIEIMQILAQLFVFHLTWSYAVAIEAAVVYKFDNLMKGDIVKVLDLTHHNGWYKGIIKWGLWDVSFRQTIL